MFNFDFEQVDNKGYRIILLTEDKLPGDRQVIYTWPESISNYFKIHTIQYVNILIKNGGIFNEIENNYYFKTLKEAQDCLNNYILPWLVMEKISR